jgi:hypothetical protein
MSEFLPAGRGTSMEMGKGGRRREAGRIYKELDFGFAMAFSLFFSVFFPPRLFSCMISYCSSLSTKTPTLYR